MSEVLLARRRKLSFSESALESNKIEFQYGGPPVEIVEIGIHLLDYPGPFYLDRGDGKTNADAKITPLSFRIRTPRSYRNNTSPVDFETRPLTDSDMKELNSDNDGAVDASYGLGFDLRMCASAPFDGTDVLLLDPGDHFEIWAVRAIPDGEDAAQTVHWIEFFGEKELI